MTKMYQFVDGSDKPEQVDGDIQELLERAPNERAYVRISRLDAVGNSTFLEKSSPPAAFEEALQERHGGGHYQVDLFEKKTGDKDKRFRRVRQWEVRVDGPAKGAPAATPAAVAEPERVSHVQALAELRAELKRDHEMMTLRAEVAALKTRPAIDWTAAAPAAITALAALFTAIRPQPHTDPVVAITALWEKFKPAQEPARPPEDPLKMLDRIVSLAQKFGTGEPKDLASELLPIAKELTSALLTRAQAGDATAASTLAPAQLGHDGPPATTSTQQMEPMNPIQADCQRLIQAAMRSDPPERWLNFAFAIVDQVQPFVPDVLNKLLPDPVPFLAQIDARVKQEPITTWLRALGTLMQEAIQDDPTPTA